jgi:hypothetical protein
VAEQVIPDYVFTNGTTPVGLAPAKRNVVTYSSPYTGQAGLTAAVTLQGGSPDQPPNDVFTCFDAPLDTVTEMDYLITPNAAVRVPRWTVLQSEFDLGDGTADRILDWQCDVVGTPADGDADGDCDPDTSDIDDGNRDIDGDLVPDGVERAYNSNPSVGDTDGDGCDDYCEIMYFTDPNDTDSDDDGQADKPDAVSTQKIGTSETGDDAPTTGTDALDLTDDNCPGVFNPSQLNTDSMYQFHGMGAGTGDATNPDEDPWGDACDLDDDNDGLPGTTEASMRIKAWTGYTGGQTTVCVGPADTPNFAPDRPMVDTQGDVDRDYVLDGIECQLRSRPDQSIRGTCSGTGCMIALNCSTGSAPVVGGGTLDEGCAQPGVRNHASPNSDPDNDGLYLPGGSQTFHMEKETFFRTRQISTALGVQVDDLDGDGVSVECPSGLMNPDGEGDIDSDRDLRGSTCQTANLRDGLEVQFYGTRPSAVDTDQDGCPDADEVNDLNGDGNSNSGDQGYMVSRILLGNLDANNDGEINLYVQALNANIDKNSFVSSGDQGLLAAAIVAPGSCQALGAFVEGAFDIGAYTKGLP